MKDRALTAESYLSSLENELQIHKELVPWWKTHGKSARDSEMEQMLNEVILFYFFHFVGLYSITWPEKIWFCWWSRLKSYRWRGGDPPSIRRMIALLAMYGWCLMHVVSPVIAKPNHVFHVFWASMVKSLVLENAMLGARGLEIFHQRKQPKPKARGNMGNQKIAVMISKDPQISKSGKSGIWQNRFPWFLSDASAGIWILKNWSQHVSSFFSLNYPLVI